MGKYISPPQGELYTTYKENSLDHANVFQLVGTLIENISETNHARRKAARELIDETLNFKLNLFEKLALHFSKEAMLAEKNKALILNIFDILTFNTKKKY